jgi:hypothetical protein
MSILIYVSAFTYFSDIFLQNGMKNSSSGRWSSKLALVVLLSFVIDLTSQTNVTVISITMEDEGINGFWTNNPVYDVIIDIIQASDRQIFQNISHIPLRYRYDENLSRASVPDNDGKEILPVPPICEIGNVSDYFFRFYYANQELFRRPLSEQLTIVTTPGKSYRAFHLHGPNRLPDI